MNCSQCGGELPENAKFCPECGSAIRNDVSDPQVYSAKGFGAAPERGVYTPPSYSNAQSESEYSSVPIDHSGISDHSAHTQSTNQVPDYSSYASGQSVYSTRRPRSVLGSLTVVLFSLAELVWGINILLTTFVERPFLVSWPLRFQFATLIIFIVVEAAILLLLRICRPK
jgi:hypothetical protein